MNPVRFFAVLSLAALASACASPGASRGDTDAAPAASVSRDISDAGTPGSMAAMEPRTMEPRMKAMQDMHQKMAAASTPAQRQALMADHLKAMQEGMAMMKEKHDGMQGMGGKRGMDHGKGGRAGMGQRHQMMTEHMAMMQLMLDMMMQRMRAAQAAQ